MTRLLSLPLFVLDWRPALAALSCALIAACGGGGGGGGAPRATASAAVASGQAASDGAALPSTLVSAVPAASYAPWSEAQQAFALLNEERQRCGFGLLAQSAQLDAAAKAHADWQILNNQLSHREVPGTPGFTGVTPLDRVSAAG